MSKKEAPSELTVMLQKSLVTSAWYMLTFPPATGQGKFCYPSAVTTTSFMQNANLATKA